MIGQIRIGYKTRTGFNETKENQVWIVGTIDPP